MGSVYKVVFKLNIITCLFFVSTKSVFAAGGTVTFSIASPTQVPTLSGTMLLLLSLLLFVVAVRTTKQKNTNKLFITLLGAGVLVTAGGGINLVSNVNAGGGLTIVVDQQSNSITYPIDEGTPINYENNANGSPALNFSITADAESVCAFALGSDALSSFNTNHSGILPAGFYMRIECFDELNLLDNNQIGVEAVNRLIRRNVEPPCDPSVVVEGGGSCNETSNGLLPPLSFDEDLSAISQAYVDTCPLFYASEIPPDSFQTLFLFPDQISAFQLATAAATKWQFDSIEYDPVTGEAVARDTLTYKALVQTKAKKMGCAMKLDCSGGPTGTFSVLHCLIDSSPSEGPAYPPLIEAPE
ncbi:CAP domain-containing protein [Cocleimonas sp. KMM 6892]|uniref:CAP domain-containing protein n=1 Tax=unclassified Cocleimonas TaxID=2639732 RepID=UPI002DB6E2DC|nr:MULTISPECIES: CAP domain-containing protein [unclassified Cocleimonas]MEB8434289.1 CAP domain-containing protein [Cocleimonas sp. KMM 6892]MEC4717092.1 CAP domain-containing protein [Cocleimonas sp. KMM 6895]MEC4746561.1 CAP domain-containing protein [Cocleimonas sp. KMM 6896]